MRVCSQILFMCGDQNTLLCWMKHDETDYYAYTRTCAPHTGKDGGCISLDSDTALAQISSGATFNQNEAVGSGGVMYMCRGATARVTERAVFTGNTAATGGCIFLPKGSQVHMLLPMHVPV
jgi:hypothetical protein